MKKRTDKVLEESLDRLVHGEKEIPIVIEGSPEQRRVLALVEELRRNILAAERRESYYVEKNKMSVAGVVHDLKTPLALISGYAQCLESGMDDKNYLALIMEKAESMNEMVLSLLETVETETFKEDGSRQAKMVNVSAKEYFKVLFENFSSFADVKSIRYSVGRVPNVNLNIEKKSMERVVQNLIGNAVKFTEKYGKIKVRFRIANGHLKISVTDNGCGIRYRNIDKVFDKFFKEDESRPAGQSTGVGLYNAKDIVESHGGRITVKSKYKKGSTFSIFLPIMADVLEPKKISTARYEALPKGKKLLFQLFFGWIFCTVYRCIRYKETRKRSLLAGIFWSIPFMPFLWITDMMDEIMNNRISGVL